jgi:hypothetical protein
VRPPSATTTTTTTLPCKGYLQFCTDSSDCCELLSGGYCNQNPQQPKVCLRIGTP